MTYHVQDIDGDDEPTQGNPLPGLVPDDDSSDEDTQVPQSKHKYPEKTEDELTHSWWGSLGPS